MSGGVGPRPPAVRVGSGIVAGALRSLSAGRRTLVVADARVGSAVLREAAAAETVTLAPASIDATVVGAIARRVRAARPDLIVAVGGGSVIDAAKVAGLAAAPGRLFEYALSAAERTAFVALPRTGAPAVALAAVPTTPGTSSESSSVAIVRTDRGTRLLGGPQLRARHAVLDAELLVSLAPDRIREGCLEALLRTAAVNTAARIPERARADSLTLGCALVRAGDLARPGAAWDRPGERAASALRIARLSSATQRTGALRVADLACARHWYVANEASFRLGVRKMAATAAIVPAVWDRIEQGDARWGDAANLGAYWRAATAGQGLPETPADGIRALVDRWGIERAAPPAGDVRDAIAEAVVREWAVRLPMLRGLTTRDVRAVLDGAWADAGWPRPATPKTPSTTGGR